MALQGLVHGNLTAVAMEDVEAMALAAVAMVGMVPPAISVLVGFSEVTASASVLTPSLAADMALVVQPDVCVTQVTPAPLVICAQTDRMVCRTAPYSAPRRLVLLGDAHQRVIVCA
jgi:hypothetical protein